MDKYILEQINNNVKLSDIANSLNVSLNKVKKLSQLNNLYNLLKYNGVDEIYLDKFKELGFKALELKDLVQGNDIEGLKEILDLIDKNTKREDIKNYKGVLGLKKIKIQNQMQMIDRSIDSLNFKRRDITKTKEKVKKQQENINKYIKKIDLFSDDVKVFLMAHLGLCNNKLVLNRRLEYTWQNNLKKKNIIEYSKVNYVWYIVQEDEFFKQVEKRIKNGNKMRWVESSFFKNGNYHYVDFRGIEYYANNDKYRKSTGLGEDFTSSKKELNKELKALKKEEEELLREIDECKNKTMNDFNDEYNKRLNENLRLIEDKKNSALVEFESIQSLICKDYFKKGYIVVKDISFKNTKFDVLCIDENKSVFGFKIVKEDSIYYRNNINYEDSINRRFEDKEFYSENEILECSKYCNYMYVFKEAYAMYDLEEFLKDNGIGECFKRKNGLYIKEESKINEIEENLKEEVILTVGKKLTDYMLYIVN